MLFTCVTPREQLVFRGHSINENDNRIYTYMLCSPGFAVAEASHSSYDCARKYMTVLPPSSCVRSYLRILVWGKWMLKFKLQKLTVYFWVPFCVSSRIIAARDIPPCASITRCLVAARLMFHVWDPISSLNITRARQCLVSPSLIHPSKLICVLVYFRFMVVTY